MVEKERAEGIEPSYRAWEARVLPLNYARIICNARIRCSSKKTNTNIILFLGTHLKLFA
jgi:hypothetical protein